jgi:hypothetical protein
MVCVVSATWRRHVGADIVLGGKNSRHDADITSQGNGEELHAMSPKERAERKKEAREKKRTREEEEKEERKERAERNRKGAPITRGQLRGENKVKREVGKANRTLWDTAFALATSITM